jgi:hypothetical protein
MDKRQVSDNMARVTDTQGTIAAYVWDYAGKMDLIRLFWEARPPLMRCRFARPRERVARLSIRACPEGGRRDHLAARAWAIRGSVPAK